MAEGRTFGVVRVALVGALALGVVGCGSGGGGGAKARARLGDAAIASAQVVATTGADRAPIDAAPGPDGTVIYFIADGTSGPAVLGVPAAGGATSTLTTGTPLVKPRGVAVATDGSRVFVADAGAGRIFSVPSGGGALTAVDGTEGRSPKGLDVAVGGGSDVVYFTGTDPADGAPGLFSVPAAGGSVSVVAKGAPLVSPDAVVVASPGVAYVTDRGGASGRGIVFKVAGSSVTRIADTRLGNPGGVSVTADAKTLLVSSLNDTTAADQVLTIDLATGTSAAASKVIGASVNSSGGLHRAYRGTPFAWADVNRSGRVYVVTTT